MSRLLVAILAIGGAAFAFMALLALQRSFAAKEWPTASGVILHSEVTSYVDDGSTRYRAEVTYRYSVGDVEYRGDRVSFGTWHVSCLGRHSSSGAESTVQRYPVGETVDVYYDPEDPATSLLEPGNHVGPFLLAVMGAVFFGIGIRRMLPRRERRAPQV